MDRKKHEEGAGRRLVVRLTKTGGRGVPRFSVRESRGDHFRKTLLLAGALSVLAFCIYFFSQAASVQATNDNSEAAALMPATR